ncbi:MAG: sialidase family protein [Tunicatimonas sp.]|uniref:sialidase family protein n=1 Tax=Tunicatimonas sp. TaxID=1940096 RepID=UPI003C78465E
MKHFLFFLFFTIATSSIQAQSLSDSIVFTDLFAAGTDGYRTYRIPGIVTTSQGTLLAWCEARRDQSDWADIDIVLRRSTDGGSTWSKQKVLVNVPEALAQEIASDPDAVTSHGSPGNTANNPVMIADANGDIHFLYCVAYQRAYYAVSHDDGKTFSEPTEITTAFDDFRGDYPWKVLATGPGHGIQRQSGRLLVPVWLSTADGGNAHRPSVVATIYSDDHGATWQAGDIAVRHLYPYRYEGQQPQAFVNPNETVAVELADGRVMLNSRSESPEHLRVVTYSADGATQWAAPKFDTALYDPVCLASLIKGKSSDGEDYLLFINPDSRPNYDLHSPKLNARRNLTAKLSYDEGKTWLTQRVIEPGLAAYSDVTVGEDGKIYVLFERGTTEGMQYAFLTLATFSLEWLENDRSNVSTK